jgi:ubiquinone/menaquinone biosynthesis C-methylase UbiE
MKHDGFFGRLRYQAGDVWHAVQDRMLMRQTTRRGGSYADFYAAKMDRKARKIGVGVNGQPEDKAFHLAFLKRQGMVPSMNLLDYGCGAAAAGVVFIAFLDEGCYTGADVSREVLNLAQERLGPAGLVSKRPAFVHLDGGSLEALNGRQFDRIWAQSVVSHMPPEMVQALLHGVKTMLKPDGAFFATFTYSDRSGLQTRVKNFDYHPDDLMAMASAAGLSASVVEGWVHPTSALDRMLRVVHT